MCGGCSDQSFNLGPRLLFKSSIELCNTFDLPVVLLDDYYVVVVVVVVVTVVLPRKTIQEREAKHMVMTRRGNFT
jgi:hypothetical protein